MCSSRAKVVVKEDEWMMSETVRISDTTTPSISH